MYLVILCLLLEETCIKLLSLRKIKVPTKVYVEQIRPVTHKRSTYDLLIRKVLLPIIEH